MKLFTCLASANCDDALCAMPGFSHRTPEGADRVRVYLYARNRTHASRQLAGVAGVRDLDGGRRCAVPAFFQARLKP